MAEIHFDFLNFNTILLILLILIIGGYLYYEIYKIKISMDDIQNKMNYIINQDTPSQNISNEIPSQNISNEIPSQNISNDFIDIQQQMEDVNISNSYRKYDEGDECVGDVSGEKDDKDEMDSIDDSDSTSYDSDTVISQSEIEKNYGKNNFENEINNANIDDILSDKHIITDNSLSDILNVDSDLTKIDEFIKNIKNTKEDDKEKNYSDMTVAELKKVLVDMKLPVSGNKTKLVERILENKKN